MGLGTMDRRQRAILCTSISALALSPISAAAQQAVPLDAIIVKTPLDGTVVTTTRANAQPQSVPVAPAQIGVLTAPLPGPLVLTAPTAIDSLSGSSAVSKGQLDQQFQADRSSEILRTIPGVTTQETARDTAQSINIRGLQDFGRVNVLIDGMRQNFQRSGHSSNGAFYLEPEMLRSIDITRGPTSVVYGSGAIGGVASFGLVDASDILKGDEVLVMRLKTRYSTNGSGPFGSATVAGRAGQFDLLGQLNGRRVDDYKDGGGATISNSREDTSSGLLRGSWRPIAGHKITGTYIDYDSTFIDSTVTGSTPRDSEIRNRQYNLGYTFARPDTPLIDLSSKIYRNETNLQQKGTTAPFAVRSFNVITEGFDINNTSRFNWGSAKMALTYGGDTFEDKVVTQDPASNGDELTPSGKRRVSGAFVQNQLTFWNMVDVIGAVRYDSYSIEGGKTSLEGNRISPKVTLGVTPIKGFMVFGTYAEGYRAPAVTETLIDGFHPGGFAFKLLPNPNLNPETAHNLEAGVNLKYDSVITTSDAFRAKLTVFQNKVDDYIGGVYSPTPPPFGQYQYQNIAKVKLDGIEFESAYDARAWFVGLGAHRIRGTDETSGAPLLSVPADQVTLSAGIRTWNSKVTAGGRVRFVAAQDRVPTGTPPADAYNILDVFAEYRHTDDLTFNLNVDNVLDKKYIQYLDQSNSPGLNARVGLTMRLGTP